ncbi:helix-turn-helix domain-containing protein [Actinoallomurus iriomotensis]|nr:helix-turn-helix domain-containing protein [Actinoallomurus iriomotensis]
MPPHSTSPDDDLLRPREVAEMFGVRTTTIARWARDGILSAVATPGGHRRYRRAEITAALRSVRSSERRRTEQDAVRLYDQGWSIRRVAEEFDMSYGAMRRLLVNNTRLRDRGAVRRSPGGT